MTEQDRRLRNIELQKKTLTNQVDSEINNRFTDYDDLIKRKRQQQSEMNENEISLLKRIAERRDKIQRSKKVEGMSKEEQDQLLKKYQNQLEQLDSAYIAEQRRQ